MTPEQEIAELKASLEHYKQTIALCWEALGITEYTGQHIAEHIKQLKAEKSQLSAALSWANEPYCY